MWLSNRDVTKMSVPAIVREFDTLLKVRVCSIGWERSKKLTRELIIRTFAKNDKLALFHVKAVEYMRESLRERKYLDEIAIEAMHVCQEQKRPYTMTKLSGRPGVTFNFK